MVTDWLTHWWRLRSPTVYLCELEAQESRWRQSHLETRRPENQEQGCGRAEGDGHLSSSREGTGTLPAPFCSIWASADWKGPHPQWWWWCGGGEEGIFFTQSADSNANLFWTAAPPSHQTPDISCFTSHLGISLAWSDQCVKLTITMY